MAFVNETTGHASRPAIQIFIAAPHREVRIPIVNLKGTLPAACARSNPTAQPFA